VFTLAANTDTDPDPGDSINYTIAIASIPPEFTWEIDLNGGYYRKPIKVSSFPEIPLPSWLTFNPATRNIEIGATRPQTFDYWMKIAGTDSSGASVSEIIRFKSYNFGGFVIDGYIAGATVFLDANKNGILDSNEPSAITTPNGDFELNLASNIFDKNQNGEIDPSEGNLVAIGGTDTATGLPLETPVTAPPDSTVITLLTSLVADLIDKGVTPAEAQSLVKTSLAIPANIDLTSLDPIDATNNNQPGGVQVLAAMVKVQNIITQTAALIDGASSAATKEIVKAVVSSMGEKIQAGTVLNLSYSADLEPIIQKSATKVQKIDPSFNIQKVLEIAPQAVQVMAEANQRIDTAASNNSGASLNTAIARIQKVALGETAKDFKEVAAGNKTIAEVVAENTGAALTSQIQTATVPDAPAVPAIGGGVEIISTAPNQIMGTNGNDAIAGTSGSDTISGQGGNDQILGLEGNDWINGNQDKDTIDGGIGDDTIYGGKGDDSLVGFNGSDVLFGNRGSDKIEGDDGNDSLYGGQSNDLLTGGNGDDLLVGQIGEDTLTGGLGNDVFLLAPFEGIDTILDFEKGQDLIGLSGGLTFTELSFTSANNTTLISVTSSGQVLASLKGVAPNWLGIDDFTQRVI
jgi:Ca2+-binding RTX toxin-like protein